MSVTEAVALVAEWQEWQHRRTRVEAIRYDGTEAGRERVADRVNRHEPGHATIWPDGGLLVRTQLRPAFVPAGFWVGIGYHGHPWVISDEVFVGCYDPAGGPNRLAVLDRDQAAAVVLAADELVEEARRDGDITGRAFGMVEQLRTYVHQLATSAEALR